MALILREPSGGQYLIDIQSLGNPNYVEHNGMPALCVAIDKYRSLTLVEALLREGANVNQQTFVKPGFSFESFPPPKQLRDYGMKLSPLHIAVVSKQLNIVRLLLENGADLNGKTSKGIEPILLTCEAITDGSNENDLEILKLLVQRGSNIHVRDYKQRSLLHRATISEKHDMVEYLILLGCDVNDVDMDGNTPLYFSQRDTKCARLLLENCANPTAQNISGDTVYHELITSNYNENNLTEFLQLLHEFNFDPNIKNNQGQTVLHLCLKYLDPASDIIKLLLEYGADPTVTDNLGRTSTFFLGASCSPSEFKESIGTLSMATLNKLFNCGITSGRDLTGYPLIHAMAKLCSECDDPLSFERIITCVVQNQVADINIRDFQDRTALHFLSAEGQLEFVQILLKHGADIDSKDCDGNTSLHVAVHCEKWRVARDVLLAQFPKTRKEKRKEGKSVLFRNKRYLQRSISVPNLPWTPKCLSVYESIFYLEDNYSNYPRTKLDSRRHYDFERISSNFPAPTLSKVISPQINATSLFETCEEHSVGDIHMEVKCDEEKCLIAKEVRHLVTDLLRKCGELDPRWKCNLLLTGSAAEGTKMWLPDEFDFMVELTELQGWCNLEKNSHLPEVIVKKERQSSWSDLLIRNHFELSPEKLRNHFNSLLQKAALSLDRKAYPNLWFNFCSYSLRKNFLQISKVGMKLSFFWLGKKYKKLLINVDLTPAIPLSEHGKYKLDERVIGMGLVSYFHVIPHSSARHNGDIIWRLSFSLAELQLIRSMSSKQVRLYKCLKFLRDIQMLNATEVPSYPLKCCIFYFVFRDGYIHDTTFNFNVREVLRRLSIYAEQEYYSPLVLRHFFLKDERVDFSIYDMRWCLSALKFLEED